MYYYIYYNNTLYYVLLLYVCTHPNMFVVLCENQAAWAFGYQCNKQRVPITKQCHLHITWCLAIFIHSKNVPKMCVNVVENRKRSFHIWLLLNLNSRSCWPPGYFDNASILAVTHAHRYSHSYFCYIQLKPYRQQEIPIQSKQTNHAQGRHRN